MVVASNYLAIALVIHFMIHYMPLFTFYLSHLFKNSLIQVTTRSASLTRRQVMSLIALTSNQVTCYSSRACE